MRMDQSDNGKQPQCHLHSARCLSTKRRIFLRDKRGVNILFYSTSGAYYGRLISTSHVNVQRQRIQAEIGHNETFKLEMSKRIIDAKIRNQVVVLRRYARGRDEDIHRMIIEMQNMQKKLLYAKSVEQVMGYEGTAAKIYFKVLGKLKIITKRKKIFHQRNC